MTTKRFLFLAWIGAGVASCAGAPDDAPSGPANDAASGAPIESRAATFSLRAVARSGEWLDVALDYRRGDGQAGPRAAELWLSHSADLTFEDAQPLAAVQAAGKRLVVQQAAAGELRLVIFGTQDLTRLDTGPVGRLRFLRASAGPARLELLARIPFFAPDEANEGVVLPDAVSFGDAGGR
jgi:hypothetical protein